MRKKAVKTKSVKTKLSKKKLVQTKKLLDEKKLTRILEILREINTVEWEEAKIFFESKIFRLMGIITIDEHEREMKNAIHLEREMCAKACEGWSDAERRTGRVLEGEGTWSQMCANIIRGRK